MLSAAGTGAAMLNASDNVKAAADIVTEADNNCAGVAQTVYRLMPEIGEHAMNEAIAVRVVISALIGYLLGCISRRSSSGSGADTTCARPGRRMPARQTR